MVRQAVVQLHAGTNTDPHIIDGATPIFIAAEKGHKAVVQLLCEAGAGKFDSDATGSWGQQDQIMTDSLFNTDACCSFRRPWGGHAATVRGRCQPKSAHDEW